MGRLIPVMEFQGKGRQMEDSDRTEPTTDSREAPEDAGEVTSWEGTEDHTAGATVLQSRRWERQEGPFRGFGSPPGRF